MLNYYRKFSAVGIFEKIISKQKGGESMLYIFVFLAGIIVGGVISYFEVKNATKPSGTFVIDLSDPMKDVCRFEMDDSLDAIYSKKRIVLKVKTYAEFSPK